jgi:antitoxin CptB
MEIQDIRNPLIAQLRWQCRRGMLELDLILLPFLEQVFPKLSIKEQEDFRKVLKLPDQTLYRLFLSPRFSPKDYSEHSELEEIITKIRVHSCETQNSF